VEQRSIEAIVQALNAAGARYLIAGGLAVVAHGYVRFTADLDLILDLEEENAKRALRALAGLGYQPPPP
jgi:phospholipase/lecithinase/hemolysin